MRKNDIVGKGSTPDAKLKKRKNNNFTSSGQSGMGGHSAVPYFF